jgi:hypothetical protein
VRLLLIVTCTFCLCAQYLLNLRAVSVTLQGQPCLRMTCAIIPCTDVLSVSIVVLQYLVIP